MCSSLFSQKLQIDAHVTYKEIICKHSIQMYVIGGMAARETESLS